MASGNTEADRLEALIETFINTVRDLITLRQDLTTLGGATYVTSILAGSDISADDLVNCLLSVANINTVLATNDNRLKALLVSHSPNKVVIKTRANALALRDNLRNLREAKLIIDRNGGLTWLTAAIGASRAGQIIDALTVILSCDAALDVGSRRLNLDKGCV